MISPACVILYIVSVILLWTKACIIKQGDFDREVINCFGTKFKLSVDLIQLLEVITVWGFTLRYCHKLFVEK